jgi:hypothetical protein
MEECNAQQLLQSPYPLCHGRSRQVKPLRCGAETTGISGAYKGLDAA